MEIILILDDDPNVTEGLAMALRGPDRRIITCHDAEAAQVVLERLPVTVALSDVRLSGPFAFEGLDLLHWARDRAPRTRVVIMSGSGERDVASEALRRGALAFLQKPFEIRSFEATIAEAS